MVREVAQFIYTHSMGTYMFDYLFLFKHGRHPNQNEKREFDMQYQDIVDKDSSYEDEDSYDSYDDED